MSSKIHLYILSWTTLGSIYQDFQPVEGDVRHILNWVTKDLSNILHSGTVIQIKNTAKLINEGTHVFCFVASPCRSQLLCMIYLLKGYCALVFIELFLSNTFRTTNDFSSSTWLNIPHRFFNYRIHFYYYVHTEEFAKLNRFKDKQLI